MLWCWRAVAVCFDERAAPPGTVTSGSASLILPLSLRGAFCDTQGYNDNNAGFQPIQYRAGKDVVDNDGTVSATFAPFWRGSMKTYALLSVAFGLAAASSASFELLLALDYSGSKLYRYDGTTGAAFGTIGNGRLSAPSSMALDHTNGTVRVYNSATGTITVLNYSTGELENEFSVGPARGYTVMAEGPNGSFFLGDFLSAGSVSRYSSTGALLATYTAPVNSAARAIGYSPDGFVYIFNTNNQLSRYNLSGGARLNQVLGPGSELNDSRQMVFQGNDVLVSTGSGNGYRKYTYGPSFWTNTGTAVSARMNFGYGIAKGHGNQVFVAGYDNNSGFIEGWERTSGTSRQLITGPAGGHFNALESVIAPEPGSVVAMAVGAAVLLRRRRAN